MIEAFICRNVYALCSWAVFATLSGVPPGLTMNDIEVVCRQLVESDRNGEIVSADVSGLTLRTAGFGKEIFLRGPDGILGYVYHDDPRLEEHCRAVLVRAVGWAP